jgi:hypothetical protein
MSVGRYFWLLGAAYLVLVATFPLLVVVGTALFTAASCSHCGIALFPLIFVLPILPMAFAVVAVWLVLARCKVTGLSRWWAVPAFALIVYGSNRGLFSANVFGLFSLLQMIAEDGKFILLAASILEIIVPIVVLVFIGLYRNAEADWSIRVGHIVAWVALVWMAPAVIVRILPFNLGLTVGSYSDGLTSIIYPDFISRGYALVPPRLLLVGALLYQLFRFDRDARKAAAGVKVAA